jgi:hypothetical protein
LSQVVPPDDRDRMLSELACRYFHLRRWQATESWPSAHVSRLRALETLHAMRLELAPYVVHPTYWGDWQDGPFVVGVASDQYLCDATGWD